MQLSAFIKNERAKNGMSQGDLAMKSGVNKMTISKLERGLQKDVSFKTAQKLADALNVNRIVFIIESELIQL